MMSIYSLVVRKNKALILKKEQLKAKNELCSLLGFFLVTEAEDIACLQ